MHIKIEITERELRTIIHKYICEAIGRSVPEANISIQVKSKQNYKSEWEEAAFKAEYIGQIAL